MRRTLLFAQMCPGDDFLSGSSIMSANASNDAGFVSSKSAIKSSPFLRECRGSCFVKERVKHVHDVAGLAVVESASELKEHVSGSNSRGRRHAGIVHSLPSSKRHPHRGMLNIGIWSYVKSVLHVGRRGAASIGAVPVVQDVLTGRTDRETVRGRVY